MLGFSRWLPATAEERKATGDPRRSIEERYPDRAAYEKAVRVDAMRLVEDGYELADDLELVVRNTLARYDYALIRAERPAIGV